MKDERAKYLIVDASDVTKQLYQVERIFYCNDFDDIYHRAEKISANEIFANNSISLAAGSSGYFKQSSNNFIIISFVHFHVSGSL